MVRWSTECGQFREAVSGNGFGGIRECAIPTTPQRPNDERSTNHVALLIVLILGYMLIIRVGFLPKKNLFLPYLGFKPA